MFGNILMICILNYSLNFLTKMCYIKNKLKILLLNKVYKLLIYILTVFFLLYNNNGNSIFL